MIPLERKVGEGLLRVVSMGFLVQDEETALMWRGLMLNRGVQHFLQDVAWGDDLDYLLVDMPPGTGDVQMGVAKLLPRAEVIVVTTPAVAAQKVAIRAVNMARKSYLRVAGVVENMSAFTCDHGESYPLFGEGGGATLAADAGVRCSGRCPSNRRSRSAATSASRSGGRRGERKPGRRGVPGHRPHDRGGGGAAGGDRRLLRPHPRSRRPRPRRPGPVRTGRDRRRPARRGPDHEDLNPTGRIRRAFSSAIARRDETELVGQDHRLHPVAQVQLGEHVVDVGLHRRLPHVQVGGDLSVGPALGQPDEDLEFALGELVETGGGPVGAAPAEWRTRRSAAV